MIDLNMLNDNGIGNKKIRNEHQKKILNLIRLAGSISRIDIARNMNISRATVTRVIDDLLQEGLVCEAGQAESKVGRRKTFVEIVPDSRYAIGVNLYRNSVHAHLIDISMKSRGNVTRSLKPILTNEDFYSLLISVVEELINKMNIPIESILGIGVGVPGLVDYESGVVWKLDITHPLTNVQLGKRLDQYFSLPTLVDNNVNTLALGEYWFGYGLDENVQQLLYVFCSEGVGGGIVINGDLFRGKNNIATEMGEMIINMSDDTTRGRVEDYCSTDVVESVTGLEFEEFCKLALEGDSSCRSIMEQSIQALGIGIVNMINILDPEMVVISGKFVELYPPFFTEVETFARSRLASKLSGQVRILKRANRDAPYEIGASALIFKPFFND